MEISNLQQNYNNSFKRVIKVKYMHHPKIYKTTPAIQEGFEALSAVLNDKKTDLYTTEEKEQIKIFFKNNVEDYDGKGPIIMRLVPSIGVVLFSGKEAKEFRNIEIKAKKQKLSETQKYLKEKEIIDKYVPDLENGHKGTKKTTIELFASTKYPYRKKDCVKIDKFNYFENQYFYTSIRNGGVQAKYGETNRCTKDNNIQNISAKYDFLTLA